jgi:hypothetical protein
MSDTETFGFCWLRQTVLDIQTVEFSSIVATDPYHSGMFPRKSLSNTHYANLADEGVFNKKI